ncbi:MAG TPA: hypothetical protein VLD67_11915 [Vicinamibacterales bacterium]|nr:hypothetical protein [Vicinamibacterales bacterium]
MKDTRVFWVIGSLAVGILQALDSGVVAAGPFVQTLVAAGILSPILAIALGAPHAVKVAALVAGAALLTWARMIAPLSLNTLHLALFAPALYIVVFGGMKWGRRASEPRML